MPASGPYLDPPGVTVPLERLVGEKPRALAQVLANDVLAFARLVECRASDSKNETVVFDVEVETPQICMHDIHSTERLAATFSGDGNAKPEVVALRADFPLVPHLNLRAEEFPRSLCLYDQPWEELQFQWTAPAFIERVRAWLSQTAQGTLHGNDQPLEPFFLGSRDTIIMPRALVANASMDVQWLDIVRRGNDDRFVLVARIQVEGQRRENPARFVATVVKCQPVQHGVIRRCPRTLGELHAAMQPTGLDLISTLKERLAAYKGTRFADPSAHLILVLLIPKCRYDGGPVESTEVKSFGLNEEILEVGVRIGLWTAPHGVNYRIGPRTPRDGTGITMEILNAYMTLSREQSALMNDLPGRDPRPLVAVGAGTLGSQLIMNLGRGGFGSWTIVDDDLLLPHNLTRHALDGDSLGWLKADALVEMINRLADDEPIAQALTANVLSQGKHQSAIDDALSRSEAIIDLAASVPVGRYLAHHTASSRRVALFMNPRGTDLVLLAEDVKRHARLDCLEMQYYRALCHTADLCEHLLSGESGMSYGQSCRDLSFRLSQDLVALYAGLGARALREALADEDATIRVWTVKAGDLSVEAIRVPVSATVDWQSDTWTIVTDKQVLDAIFRLREGKLPCETGGVLIGSYDMQRKLLYVVDVLPSPPDSEEYPTAYIRGSARLQEQVEKIRQITKYNLDYVGEWHSHPEGYAVEPSSDDAELFSWLQGHMSTEGKPALLVIAGAGNQAHWWLS